MDSRASQTSVSLSLSLIKKRCQDLLDTQDNLEELKLEDDTQPAADDDNDGDPYNQQK